MNNRQFKAAKFMTVKDKALVLRAWETFLKHGLKRENFTKRLYEHLHLHCSFIAHYNIEGFYATYFQNPEDTKKFLRQFDNDGDHHSVEIGMTYWLYSEEYGDLNQAMCDALDPYKATFYQNMSIEAKDRDITQAKALLEKHGMALPSS